MIAANGHWDWQELGQATIIGLVFAFLVAKLIAIALSFHDSNLKISRATGPNLTGGEDAEEVATLASEDRKAASAEGEDDGESSDDWEGIECTALDEEFSAASAFVAATAADRATASRVSSDVQLQLYAFYKIATEGPCTTPQPSPLKLTARTKWNAWQKLGAMPAEEAMQNYVMIVNELFPSWSAGSTGRRLDREQPASTSEAKGTMGPVFSSLVAEEDANSDLILEGIHVSAREGATDDILKCLDSGVSVNLRDTEGRTPLHWAVDRGHMNVAQILLNANADVNAKDHEGQTPLHYAAMCEREGIAEMLVKHHHADPHIKDNEGNSPLDLCTSPWGFLEDTEK